VALEALRVTTIYPRHLVTILAEILPTLPKTGNLSRIVLDAGGTLREEDGEATWHSLDAVMSKHVEKTSTKHPSRRLALQFCTGKGEAMGERNRWARYLSGLLVLFSKVGEVEYVSGN